MGKGLLSFGAAVAVATTFALSDNVAAMSSASDRSTSNDLMVAMLVCTPDGCRHRSKPYRARPAWNAYLMREHPPSKEGARAGERPVGGLLDLFFAPPCPGEGR